MTQAAQHPVPTTVRQSLDLLDGDPTDVVAGIAVTRTGQPADRAPTLLLLHGLGSSRSVWTPVLPLLAHRYHLLVVDLPGHGRSGPLTTGADCRSVAQPLARAAAELGAEAPHVVGNSLGGWIALEMAADAAASSVVALAPAGLRLRPVRPGPLLRLNRALALRTRRIAGPLLDRRMVRLIAFTSVTAHPGRVDPDLARSQAAAVASSTGYEAMLEATGHHRFERGRQVVVPTVIAFGDRDLLLPGPWQRPDLAPPDARWVRIPHCGHTPMWDDVDRTVELVGWAVDEASRPTGGAADGAT